jgi:hypothetical protein
LEALVGLLRRWPRRRRMSKGFLDEFSISLGRAPTWARVLRMNNKPMTMIYLLAETVIEYHDDLEALLT